MQNFDEDLVRLILNKLLLPQFEHAPTVVRKQVVTAMAELRLAIDVRLKSDCMEKVITFEGLVEDKLN